MDITTTHPVFMPSADGSRNKRIQCAADKYSPVSWNYVLISENVKLKSAFAEKNEFYKAKMHWSEVPLPKRGAECPVCAALPQRLGRNGCPACSLRKISDLESPAAVQLPWNHPLRTKPGVEQGFREAALVMQQTLLAQRRAESELEQARIQPSRSRRLSGVSAEYLGEI